MIPTVSVRCSCGTSGLTANFATVEEAAKWARDHRRWKRQQGVPCAETMMYRDGVATEITDETAEVVGFTTSFGHGRTK